MQQLCIFRLTVAAYLSLNVFEGTDSSKMRSKGNITRLPQEPLALICSHLGPGDICRLQETCGFLYSALREPKAPVYCCSPLLRFSALLLHVGARHRMYRSNSTVVFAHSCTTIPQTHLQSPGMWGTLTLDLSGSRGDGSSAAAASPRPLSDLLRWLMPRRAGRNAQRSGPTEVLEAGCTGVHAYSCVMTGQQVRTTPPPCCGIRRH